MEAVIDVRRLSDAELEKTLSTQALTLKTDEARRVAELLGEEGAAQKQENCVLLQTLRGHMDSLMRTTEAKWAYMFAKIDKELARPAGQ